MSRFFMAEGVLAGLGMAWMAALLFPVVNTSSWAVIVTCGMLASFFTFTILILFRVKRIP